MSRIAYVNGRYVPHRYATVHIEDRGYQFSDGVYEVCVIRDGWLIDMGPHLDRLERSLAELRIPWPLHRSALERILIEVVRRNHVRNGTVYLQVTRGVAPRDHPFPAIPVRPALVVTSRSVDRAAMESRARAGIRVITVPDNRWDRVDIKTVGLLPNVLAKQAAREQGAQEAWFIDADGRVTEGGSTNAWIVNMEGEIITRPAEHGILRGITRNTAIEVAESLGWRVVERPFHLDEALRAREAFVTSATSIVTPVISIDGQPVANGRPGSVAQSLRDAFFDIAEKVKAC